MNEITASLERALDRIDEFRSLHDGTPAPEHQQSVRCLQEAVGIGEQSLGLIGERLFTPDSIARRPAEMLLGVIVGLLAAQFEAERQPALSDQ